MGRKQTKAEARLAAKNISLLMKTKKMWQLVLFPLVYEKRQENGVRFFPFSSYFLYYLPMTVVGRKMV